MSQFSLQTVNDVFALVSSRGVKQALLWQRAGQWVPITSAQFYGLVRALAQVFSQWGVLKGDRIVILSENRWEWAVTDFAAFALGAVDVPLYATNTAEQIGYMLRDSGAKIAVVSSREQYDKLLGGDFPELEHVIVMDDGDFEGADNFATLIQSAATLEQPDAAFDAQVQQARPDDLATIIYTSGTTGEPKGVMLTHGNLASNVNVSTRSLGLSEKDSCISFLPLSHVTARHLDYAMMCHGARLAYCPRFDQLPAAMKAVKPTIFVGVPRVFEKIRQAVEGKSTHSAFKKRILAWALGTGKRHRGQTLAGDTPSGLGWTIADKLVFSKIREAFGGCARLWVSGGAPLGTETAGWFADAGIRIFEGYGLTETSPVIAISNPDAYRFGTVGKPLPNLEVRFAPDNELEVRGPSVFNGYWNKPKESADAFTDDRWFKTGDIGNLDQDGYLSITDRKKELLKTSGGKLIAPQPIENKLKGNILIAQAALVGDKHKFACVLISPNFEALEKWAAGQGIAVKDHAALVQSSKVIGEYERLMNAVNGSLAHYETMKRLYVVPDEWTVEGGEMTASMKLKRRVIETKYKQQIAAFYADEATSKE